MKMKVFLIFLSFAVFGINSAVIERSEVETFSEAWKRLEESNYTVEGVIQSNGYEVETHQVTTTDGYILTLQRIPRGNTGNNNGKIAFLQHGIIISASDWVIMGAGKSLAFLLADEGYDVWMGNVRGSTFSRKHTVLDPSEAKFWNFSWHEIGTIDVPQMIDYVLNETQADAEITKELLREAGNIFKARQNSHAVTVANVLHEESYAVYYVGHSQGTTVYYVMTSELPEYNSKIKVQVSLAPIGYMSNLFSPLPQILSSFIDQLDLLFKLIGLNELLPTSDFTQYVIGDVFCGKDAITQGLCVDFLFLIYGFDRPQMNTTLLPTLLKFYPGGCSRKQVVHYGQLIKSGYFRQYDYGKRGNLEKYGDQSPPSYNLENITAPTYLIYSKGDWLSSEVDVKKLCEEMKNGCKGKFLVNNPHWNHLDYMYGSDAPELIYSNISSLFKNY